MVCVFTNLNQKNNRSFYMV